MNRTHISLLFLSCSMLCLTSCLRVQKKDELAKNLPCPVQQADKKDASTQAFSIHHLKNPQEFADLLKQGKPVILKISATWCGPCRYMAPLFEKEANKYCNVALFASIDADEKNMEELVGRYASRGFPTFNFFDKKGVLVKDHPGSYPENEFAEEIKNFVEKYS